MQHLPATAKDDLHAGSHVCCHSDGAAAVSGDMFGEQTCIKQGKGVAGMKGISTLSRWQCRSNLSASAPIPPSHWMRCVTMLKLWKRQWSPTYTKSVKDGESWTPSTGLKPWECYETTLTHSPQRLLPCTMALLAWLLVVRSKRRMELSILFKYKFGPVPASIIDDYRCIRKCNNSLIVNILESLFPIPTHQTLSLLMQCSLSTTWCGHHQPLWQTSQPAWGAGLIATSPKYLLSLISMSKSLPKTTRGREEPGRAQQSTNSHWQPPYLAAIKWWNKTNKRWLGELLRTHHIGDHIEMVSSADSIVTHDEADM